MFCGLHPLQRQVLDCLTFHAMTMMSPACHMVSQAFNNTTNPRYPGKLFRISTCQSPSEHFERTRCGSTTPSLCLAMRFREAGRQLLRIVPGPINAVWHRAWGARLHWESPIASTWRGLKFLIAQSPAARICLIIRGLGLGFNREFGNRPQPLWQPPPTACRTASGATSEAPSLLMQLRPPPSGCSFLTGPWTVTRSSLRVLRRVAAFCRPLRHVCLVASLPR